MSERLIRPYEISVWEDELTQNGFIEKKLAVIGSDTMTGLNKVYDPVFNKKSNGEKTLSFSLKYKYFDPYSGNSDFINPFAALLINERKVKLKYGVDEEGKDKWYEFIVKDHTESSDELTWTYTCTDAFVLELSKNGYNITFDTELNNNQGTARELATETLKNTDWQLKDANVGRQLVAEPIYKATLVSTNNVTIINTDSTAETVSSGASIYLFYSYIKNQNGKYVQFIIRNDNRNYTIDDNNIITDTNFRIEDELVYKSDGFYKDSTKIISWGEIETKYQANRLVYSQRTTYDPVMERTVDIFKAEDREIYKYTDYVYTTSNVVTSYITNGDNFNILEDGTLQGWNPYTDQTNGSVNKLELITYPELGTGKELADLATLSQIDGYLKVTFNDELKIGTDGTVYNTLYNSGFENNLELIQSISKGDKFVFRWKGRMGGPTSQLPTNQIKLLRMMVARYTQDAPTRYGYYYKHIKSEDIILRFDDEPKELNNIVTGGSIQTQTIEGKTTQNYVIDGIPQVPSTKYLYEVISIVNDSEVHTNYIWNPETQQFIEANSSNYVPYYYVIAEAEKTVSNAVLKDPDTKIGIFLYSENTQLPKITYFLQDVQFTRFVPDGSDPTGQTPILLGNIPTATSVSTDTYYLKPSKGAAAEDVETYASLASLAEALGLQETDIVPVYNEDSEKILSITASQSNCFNVLQTIAETFECWIDLVVEHDDQGYITYTNNKPNKFVYLKEYAGKDNWAGFKYGINLESIERTVNSDEIVTKLIVDSSQSDYVDEGYVSIMNAPSNQSGESYIINFDYYYNQGLLDREAAEADRLNFVEAVAAKNKQLQAKEKQRRDLEASLTVLDSERNVLTELVDTAKDLQGEALNDFYDYTGGQTYEEYRQEHTTLPEDKQLTKEDTIFDILGRLYSHSATINNYSGILTNKQQEYWKVRKQLRGSENYKVSFWKETDINQQEHIIVELDDYLPGFHFTLGSGYEGTFTISKKHFDITSNATTISFTQPQGYNLDPSENNYTINLSPQTVRIINVNHFDGIEDEIEQLQKEKEELVNDFNNTYSRYIQEGTWNSTDYIDSELYYLDALQVSNTSARPEVSYSINVVEVSELEGLEWYTFDTGDKTYVEDTEFFGWSYATGHLSPAREEVIVSEIEWHLDRPEETVITVQNYKTRFEDLFQRISATVQTVQYNEATYAKMSSLLDANGTINQNVLLESLNRISGKQYNLTSDGSVLINGNQILIQNLTNPANRVIINNEGVLVSADGGNNWKKVIDGYGINADAVITGSINTNQVIIGDSTNPSFRWDKSGISAYKSNEETGIYDLQTYVRYDEYGLYGIKNDQFKASSLQDVLDKAHFAVTWDGFFIKNSYEGGGRVEITSDNDFRVLNDPSEQGNFQEKIKIGALEWGEGITSPTEQGATALPTLYGIRIKNDDGVDVFKTGDNGDLEITGTIYADAGEIGGMVVNNDWLRMNYIVLEPGEGIYSTYPNVKGEPPVDPSISTYPFWISDTDGSATFNNITVRGSIKTSVFEYEEIQAVGGAFMFRPSSAVREVTRDGNDLIFRVEKLGLFKEGSWLKISNYSSETAQDVVTPDVLNGFGLTYIYPIPTGGINGRNIRLTGAAEIIDNQVTTLDELCGGSLIDMGNQAGTSNYGIGINSSDGYINLPPRAISLFETVIHPNQDPKVSYRYRGILGTLPDERLNNLNVDSEIYQYLRNTQGIYTDNMYLGDNEQFLSFYTDTSDPQNPKKKLRIRANQVVFEVYDKETGEPTGEYQDINDYDPEGTPGPAGQDAIRVAIESNVGNEFIMSQETATLTCTVYKGAENVTSQVTQFLWTKNQASGEPDTTWNTAHENYNLPYIEVTPSEINKKAVFGCRVTLPE